MSGLLRRALGVVTGWLSRVTTAIICATLVVVRTIRTVAVRVAGYTTAAVAGIRQRHRERLDRDAGYRTAIATGLSALLITVTPQPAVAAALAVLVSEHLGTSRHTAGASYSQEPDDDDGFDEYEAGRAWSARSPVVRPAQRPWDGWRS